MADMPVHEKPEWGVQDGGSGDRIQEKEPARGESLTLLPAVGLFDKDFFQALDARGIGYDPVHFFRLAIMHAGLG